MKNARGRRSTDHFQPSKGVRRKFACVIEEELVQSAIVRLYEEPHKAERGALAKSQRLEAI